MNGGPRFGRKPREKRTVMYLVVLAPTLPVVLGSLLVWRLQPAPSPTEAVGAFVETEGAVYPSLADRMAEAATIIVDGPMRTTLVRGEGGNWRVAEEEGYPAAAESVQALLRELSSMRLIYEADRLPATVAGLSVTSEQFSPEAAARVVVADREGEAFVEALIGGTISTPGGDQLTSVVMKRPGDDEVLIADSALQPVSDPFTWVDREVIDMPVDRIYSAEIEPRGVARRLVLQWEPPAPGSYSARGVSEDVELTGGQWGYRWMASALEDLSFEEVRKREPSSGLSDDKVASRAVFTTFDGLRVTCLLYEGEENFWLRFEADRVDPVEPEDPAWEARNSFSPDQIESQADAINEKGGNWEYAIPSITVDKLFRKPVEMSESS